MMNTKKHILFVDDDPNFLAGLFRNLRNMSEIWEMSSVGGVDEALEFIAQNEVDVVITDFRMVGKDGLELLGQIMSSPDTGDLPVVMLTGSDEADLKRRALELGAADLLSKPVNREDLIARISSVLRLKSYQDELKNMNQTLEAKVLQRTAELEMSHLDVVYRLARAGEYRDEGTGNHVLRVGHYSRVLAEILGLETDIIKRIFISSPLHDIGKIGIPDAILRKPGKLTPEERAEMEKHCEIGGRILQCDPEDAHPLLSTFVGAGEYSNIGHNLLLDMARTIALYHHERWDGNGYPHRINGEYIPLEARIVSVADVYDALSTERPYKPAFSQEKVLDIMREQREAQFCPTVFDAMESAMDQFLEIRTQLADSCNILLDEAA